MRRSFEEISDNEWDNHSFKPSRVLKKPAPSSKLPSIESFAYRPNSQSPIILDDDDDDEFCEIRNPVRPPTAQGGRARRFVVDDDDDGVVTENGSASMVARTPLSRGQVLELRSSDEEFSWTEDEKEEEREEVEEDEDDEEEEVEEDEDDEEEEVEEVKRNDVIEVDVIGRALRKCARISSALRHELFGSTTTACDRYSEVEVSSCRIVTQEDVNAACENDESDFEPILKPYQLVGVNFLLLLYRKNIGGAILADEMGLGKTIQAVTYLALLEHLDNDPGPHLIVCPASLLENWERELKRWCPSFSVILFHGPGKTTYSKKWSSRSKAGLPAPFNVLLVCYSLFERRSEQQKDDRKTLKRWQWSCVLMDEAHLLKDKNSFRWKNLMSVAKNARQRLMLTGTPLQNDLHELWSLLEFMLPDIFATEDVDLKKLLNAEDKDLISRIKSILGPFILRRLKSDVMQQLVPKTQSVQYVHMTSEQSTAYEDAINEYRAASRSCFGRSSTCTTSNVVDLLPKRQISNYFMQFRKIANHPLLIRRFYHDEDVIRIANILYPKGVFGFECSIDRAIQEIKSYNDFEIHRLLISYGDEGTKGVLSDDHVLGSAKCRVLAELLPNLERDGHRVLIFSQWTHMLDILEWTLEVIGVTYKRLDGSTQVLERQTIVDTFNSDPSIFACLLSTRSGGQGLNLIGADTVIIHDMDFNPQVDRQAEDRCHRIGQNKPVTVYRFVTKNTVDENIYEIARRKLVLDAAVLQYGTVLDDEVDLPEKTMGEILSALLLV